MAGNYTKLEVWTRVPVNLGVEGISTPGEKAEIVGEKQIWMALSSPQARTYVRIDCYDGGKSPAFTWLSDGSGWTNATENGVVKTASKADAEKAVADFHKAFKVAEAERQAEEEQRRKEDEADLKRQAKRVRESG